MRQGKIRLSKYYETYTPKEKERLIRDVFSLVNKRKRNDCCFIEWKENKIIYKTYANLHFIACINNNDNELIGLEIIHHFVVYLFVFEGILY